MKNFKSVLSLALFIFLAFSGSHLFFAEFYKNGMVISGNYSPLNTSGQNMTWSTIPCAADGFNIITKATLIAQRMEQENFSEVNMPVLALQ
ncbi:hypothetical protein [Catalinimonas niigatensis]|uniref:hypothetical protein n=1 Tax=Catalinimonas niigatensis TaxID=1397264 RepID=UPI0026656AD4|nr:hypothetical protein [Catalinimonas niigatensis]WPP48551.1 hypothetical protein PZB72_17925 [Catalinimonas niigatensis]